MDQFSRFHRISFLASASFIAFSSLALAQGPSLVAHPISGAAPVINGTVGSDEWPTAPQISITQTPDPWTGPPLVLPTFTTFASDSDYLYVLVDAPGDTTSDSPCDECLLVFGWEVGGAPQQLNVEIYKKAGEVPVVTTPGVVAAIGFGTSPNSSQQHRIYEFRIPLDLIGNPAPGGALQFCSPGYQKVCFDATLAGSMPYDGVAVGSPYHDNIWPFDLEPANRNTWATVTLALAGAVPTLEARGLALLAALLAGAAILALGRRST